MRVADAFGALKLLRSHPYIDQNRIGIMGYSSGGFASLLSYDEKVRKNMVEENLRFAAHVNVYASSMLIFKENQPTNSPMLFLMGEKDNTCPLNKMIAYTEKLKDAGGNIRTIVYPGAHHVFDAQGPVRTFKAENDGNCQFEILNNGNLVDSVTGEQFPEKDLYSDNNKYINPCKTNTVSFGRNNFAAKQYKIDVIDFFVNALNP
jgi:dienelactone hydrolase